MSDSELAINTVNTASAKFSGSYLEKAQMILRGETASIDEMLSLAKALISEKNFTFARRLMARAGRNEKLLIDLKRKTEVYQKWALYTYKDPDLPVDVRLDEALNILRELEDIDQTKDQETLGMVGAIYKRKWEVDNQTQNLERSLLYYLKGYRIGVEKDQGYNGINAAFILDLLAFQEKGDAETAHTTSVPAEKRQARAQKIREDIIARVPPLIDRKETVWLEDKWWFYSTIAEAYFGLQKYEEAVEWLNRGKDKLGVIEEWELESTVRQLARLASIQSKSERTGDEFKGTNPWQALEKFFGTETAAVRSAFIGKMGLALSGGGFRAALFHIGTLAKLAEFDVLRHIEVFSCVSGGSIIGAHYYLEVRKLLKSKTDAEITKDDYIAIVKRIEKDFLKGVQRNIRVRVAAEITTNLKMLFYPNYSRTERAGELYEEEIFSRIEDGDGKKPRYLNKLNIQPEGETNGFAPKLHNWRRAAKVPILLLNSTTLNTGHNWQFTTSWMGEPASSVDTEVDTNDWLRRMYYTEAPPEHQNIRLGHAVSASAGVPGIFEPLNLNNLYPDRVIRLVDGGVCDNQGVSSLLEQECTVILASDASGQMESQKIPGGGILPVLLRSNSILQSRIRDTQYYDLEKRRRTSLLRGLMFIHLKEDLDTDPVDWVGCQDPFMNSENARPPERSGILTKYGVVKDLQNRLAAIRTDLDSFTDVEAYTLMTSAYLMTQYAFNDSDCIDGFAKKDSPEDWNFLELRNAMNSKSGKYGFVESLLNTSSQIAFKVWQQYFVLKIAAIISGIAAVVILAALCWFKSEFVILGAITLGGIGKWILGAAATFLLTYFLGQNLIKIVRWRDTLLRGAFFTAMVLFGWLIAWIHLLVFDKLFLYRGSIKSFRKR